MANITILMGSSRKNGNTAALTRAFAEGVSGEHQVRILSVADYRILPCSGCNACYRSDGHRCIQQDDMTQIYAILQETDILAAASPVYFYGISAILKTLIDRLHTPARSSFRIQKLGLLLVGASALPDLFEPILMQYRMILRYFSLESIGTVLVRGVCNPGDILKTTALSEARALGASIK